MPQIALRPFMAGTMVQAPGRVKSIPAPAKARRPRHSATEGVNAALTFLLAFSRWTDPGPGTAGAQMRSLLATITFAILLGASAAQAEKRIFIVANNADGYGVDRCLASGDHCGKAAATAYCKSRKFVQASSYRQVDKDEITGAIPANAGGCKGGTCEQFIAIECSR